MGLSENGEKKAKKEAQKGKGENLKGMRTRPRTLSPPLYRKVESIPGKYDAESTGSYTFLYFMLQAMFRNLMMFYFCAHICSERAF